jgi:hypothetical protein
MTKNDKIGAIVLGVALFGGLFYVIYSSIFGPQPDYTAYSNENTISDEFDNGEDFGEEEVVPAETPAPSADSKASAPAAAAKPAAPAKK